ncbi:MAG: Xaa-Pro peptidase family protein [Bacillota bacterium]|nr:Xaa-Pro peptidase family protein [Bacillota bacterium]
MNRDQLERSLAQSDLDAVVCVSPENVFYLSDVAIQTQRTIPDRLALVVWPRGDQPTFIVCSWEEAQAKAESWIADIRSYVEFQVSPMQLLADVLRERGLAAGRLGLDMRGLASLDYLELRELVPSARIVDGTSVMARARMIKTAKEVERLREAAEVTDRVIRDVFSPIAEGMTECEVATRLKTHLLCAGADSIAFTIFAGGANSSITHPAASDYRLRRGDLIRTDFGGAFGEYLSDLARTAVVGAPQQEHVAMYATLWEIHQALIAQMTPGTRASDLFHSCRRLYEASGIPFSRAHIGHGIGLNVHEHPVLSPRTDEILQPNMVICLEISHTTPGVSRYHLEDTVVVGQAHPAILSRTADWRHLLITG